VSSSAVSTRKTVPEPAMTGCRAVDYPEEKSRGVPEPAMMGYSVNIKLSCERELGVGALVVMGCSRVSNVGVRPSNVTVPVPAMTRYSDCKMSRTPGEQFQKPTDGAHQGATVIAPTVGGFRRPAV
jgi:hypothetical protein